MIRRNIMLALLPVVLLLPFLVGLFGGIGPYELLLWLVLVAAWVVAYIAWARPRQRKVH
ncbi:MAG: hypothetical protein J2P23_04615 [Microlunatus sp.]|nr:hypothetical protein [Microlunatus sp.]